MNLRRILICFGLVLLLNGCATNEDNIRSALQNGEVDKALAISETALRDEPKNTNLIDLQRMVRLAWLDRRLIDVRLFRLAGNFKQSESTLADVLARQTEWQLFPTGAVFATQNEELKMLNERTQIQIQKAILDHHPLLAHWLVKQALRNYGHLLRIDFSSQNIQIKKIAETQCQQELKKATNKSFYHNWIWQKFCATWSIEKPWPHAPSPVQLFKNLIVEVELKAQSAGIDKMIAESLNAALKKSQWYDSNSSVSLKLKIDGQLSNTVRESEVERAHQFTVQVPYENKEVKKKGPPPSGLSAFFQLLGALSGSQGPREIDNGDGTVTVIETRYRDEGRTYRYRALEVEQKLFTQFNATASLPGGELAFPFKEEFSQLSDEHNENSPDINLYPAERKIVETTEWVFSWLPRLAGNLSIELGREWQTLFCNDLQSEETLLRCSYGKPAEVPSTVDQWFLKTFALNYANSFDEFVQNN